MSSFSDANAVARYTEGPVRLVPGFLDLQRMTQILLAEHAKSDANILVLGAGGGLEIKAFAQQQPDWKFVGVDPSAEMLKLASDTLGPLSTRVHLHEGYIDSAPMGPFDGATCLLTMHFVPQEERVNTLIALRNRLKPGAPLIMAHHSYPTDPAQKTLWLARYSAFAIGSGVPADDAQNAAKAVAKQLPVISPQEEEATLRDAGFTDIDLFYAGFTFRGWVALAP